METEKERSTGDRTESSSSIPLDVTIEILVRLPAKSIGKFRCVSKLWSSMTTTPGFVKSFSVHSSARPSLLSFKNEEDKRVVFYSLPHHHHKDPRNRYSTHGAEKFQMVLPKEETGLRTDESEKFYIDSFDLPQSVQGLISFANFESVIIWNPTLRQHVTLPEPKVSKPLISLLGYDPIGGEYKVLCMSLCNDARKEYPQILTMGARESWRTLIHNSPGPIHCQMKSWRCIKGVVYYFTADLTMASFDVRSEKFGVIQLPQMLRYVILQTELPMACGSGFISHRGRLAWFYHFCSLAALVSLWVLEDAEKHEWSQEESLLPFQTIDIVPRNGESTVCYLLLSGETADDDELIYLPTSTDGPFYAIYYDLERDSVRKVVYDGIEDNEFRFRCFPNHIESLMPLNNLLAEA